MAIENPDTPIRMAYINALSITGWPVWDERVPLNITPIPKNYITLDSQTKQPFERTKDCFEWLTSLNVNMWQINTPGYVNKAPLDSVEKIVINGIESILIPGFIIQDILLIQSQNLPIDTVTTSIERRVLIYQIILWQV
jgi:hypothetical protein